MATTRCVGCDVEIPRGQMISIANCPYCKTCGEQRLQSIVVAESPEMEAVVAAHVCGYCGAQMDTADENTANGVPICPGCAAKASRFPLPMWLKAGLAISFALLIVALIHGGKFFSAGRAMYRGEKLIAKKRYVEAAVELRKTLAPAPDCKKCALLLAKADLLSGNPAEAYDVTAKKGFERDDLFSEVEAIFKRADSALGLVDGLQQQMKEGQSAKALETVKLIKNIYPEWQEIATVQDSLEIDVAFKEKNYDRFLEIARSRYEAQKDSSDRAGLMASALACKFAASGEERYRAEAEGYLTKGAELAKSDEERASFKEYEERIRHRLQSREIIEKDEYDRRYRSNAGKKEGK